MSILIKGMEMPKDGELLCINIYPDVKVCINLDLDCNQIATAVNVPPHGRLINADALLNKLQALYDERSDEARYTGSREIKVSWDEAVYQIIDAPTIIPKDVTDTNDGNILNDQKGEVEQSTTVNILPAQYQIVKQIDLTQDSIEQIADAVVRKLTAEEGE